jgi:plasmid stabilization system protein ParE
MSLPRRKTLRWRDAAVDDLVGIVQDIAQHSPQAAERFADAIFDRVDKLQFFPHLGSVCPYYVKARQLIHGNYIIYYTVYRKEVVIRAVVHGARLFRSYWLRRGD